MLEAGKAPQLAADATLPAVDSSGASVRGAGWWSWSYEAGNLPCSFAFVLPSIESARCCLGEPFRTQAMERDFLQAGVSCSCRQLGEPGFAVGLTAWDNLNPSWDFFSLGQLGTT